jgi:hypothetical protein
MRTLRCSLYVAFAVIAVAACGPAGFDRPALTKGLGVQLPPADGAIARALEVKPGTRPPLEIAVYLYPEPLAKGGSRAWSWKGRDREALLAATQRLQRDKVVADMFVLSLVPGTHRDALFLTRGAMWDVRTGYLSLTIETEAKARTLRPGAFSTREAALDQAKEDALDQFRDDLVRRLRRLTPA